MPGTRGRSEDIQESMGYTAPSSSDIWGQYLEARSPHAVTTLISVAGFDRALREELPIRETYKRVLKAYSDPA